ncbi:tRNA pseudouridine55 synthase [Frondihabitans sp. PhB188]|nr:tRNA pseudouridine(55) synthase TruB [Frondihabitans sp. PhB188]ROQ41252.1 tRNA pseudouridine55 synthase [Frondihabitans sp. PhB188]
MNSGPQHSGILLVDKPQGITSHDVVSRVRKAAGTRKVGHAGTLDPMATGLLVTGVNSSTRLLTFLVGLGKTYEATIRLGSSTDSDDADGTVTATADPDAIAAVADDAIAAGVAELTGDIQQVPTTVSAIKVDGRRAYDLAREGVEVELKARAVTVSRFEIVGRQDSSDAIDLDVVVDCSSGTYIRALARDLGAGLGVGGHLTALRRTKIGPFDVADAIETLDAESVRPALLAPAVVARRLFSVLELTAEQAVDLGHGKKLAVDLADTKRPVAAISPGERLVGLVSVSRGTARPIVNFPTDEVRS